MAKTGDPLFTVKLAKGLADRKRLPLEHVISVLDELRQLITEIGKEVQRRKGTVKATGDFGLELVAGEKGIAFQPGSVQANIVVTERPGTGFKVIQSVIKAVELLDSEDFPEASADQNIDRRIIHHLSRIARIQKSDKTEMRLSIIRPGQEKAVAATFGSNAIQAVQSLQAATFRVEDTILYGKLFQLMDKTADEEEEKEKGFWGELKTDAGETWRIHFLRPEDLEGVIPLFRKQVKVTGAAVYYRLHHPKLICKAIELDKDRDLEAAFDELYGCDKNLYKTDLGSILKELHGED
jgi:hypothetical protein